MYSLIGLTKDTPNTNILTLINNQQKQIAELEDGLKDLCHNNFNNIDSLNP